jgi:hypothetical protein
MSFFTTVLNLLPKAAKPNPIDPDAKGVLMFPAAPPTEVREAPLDHTTGGLDTDGKSKLRPRVSVFLGPGATFVGIAELVLPLYEAAAAGGGHDAPDVINLARGLLQYNATYLPTGTWTNHRVGLRLPLPIEIEAPGHWIVNARTILELSSLFNDRVSTARLTIPPDPIFVPVPSNIEDLAVLAADDGSTPSQVGEALRANALRNPFDSVFTILATLRALDNKTRGAAAEAVLGKTSLEHQLAALASTSAGNGILRCFNNVLKNAPASTDKTRKDNELAALEKALHEGPTSARTLVLHRELPTTRAPKGSKAPKKPEGPMATDLAKEPKDGTHRRVLGYDVNVGKASATFEEPITARVGTIITRFTGPGYEGRLDLTSYLRADGRNINKNNQDAELAARIEIITAIEDNLFKLDAVRSADLHILNVGIFQWALDEPAELPALLSRFKNFFPDEFDLFFALHRLDVRPDPDPAHAGRFLLQKIDDDGVSRDMTASERTAFFGKTFDPGLFPSTFFHRPEWAARFRLAALASLGWRRVQVLEAAKRFDRIKAEIGLVSIGSGRSPRQEVLRTLITSKKGVAVILDSHVVQPGKAKSELVAQAKLQKASASADALDKALTKAFEVKRTVASPTRGRVDPAVRVNGPTTLVKRNKNIDATNLDATHGSFTGWGS